jgi:hypothetical protein
MNMPGEDGWLWGDERFSADLELNVAGALMRYGSFALVSRVPDNKAKTHVSRRKQGQCGVGSPI